MTGKAFAKTYPCKYTLYMYSANINNHATVQEMNVSYPSKQKVAKFSSATSN